jgi:hypothetical protein
VPIFKTLRLTYSLRSNPNSDIAVKFASTHGIHRATNPDAEMSLMLAART